MENHQIVTQNSDEQTYQLITSDDCDFDVAVARISDETPCTVIDSKSKRGILRVFCGEIQVELPHDESVESIGGKLSSVEGVEAVVY